MLHDENKTGSKFREGEANLEYSGKPINTGSILHDLALCISIAEKLSTPLNVCGTAPVYISTDCEATTS